MPARKALLKALSDHLSAEKQAEDQKTVPLVQMISLIRQNQLLKCGTSFYHSK